jgi:hypothetical protein
MWVFLRRAITAVGDRSFLTEILALMLAVSLVWPNAGSTRSDQPTSSKCQLIGERSLGNPLIRSQAQAFKPAPERQLFKHRGVLDDDPAVLADESEDWIEDFSSFAAAYSSAPAPGLVFMVTPVVGINAGSPPNAMSLIHALCRYRC